MKKYMSPWLKWKLESLLQALFNALIALVILFDHASAQVIQAEDYNRLKPGVIVEITLNNGERFGRVEVIASHPGRVEGNVHHPDQKEVIYRKQFLYKDIQLLRLIDPSDPAHSLSEKVFASDSTVYYVRTKDGNEFTGKVISQDPLQLKLASNSFGEITIQKVDIVEWYAVESKQIRQGVFWPENPQSTRYFWSPNGYGLKPGEGYYQNVWLFFNQFSVGITQNLSVGVGTVPVFLMGGGSSPIWFTPKFSIPLNKDKFQFGAGCLCGTFLPGANSQESKQGFGIAYGTTTFGSRDNNISIGLGYGYTGGGWSKYPTVTFSAMQRTGRNSYFITENYLFSSSTSSTILLMLGGRKLMSKTALDFGVMMPISPGMASMIILPWLGVSASFGKK